MCVFFQNLLLKKRKDTFNFSLSDIKPDDMFPVLRQFLFIIFFTGFSVENDSSSSGV